LCLTRVNIRHSYDTCTTCVEKQVFNFFFPLLQHYLDWCPTPVKHSYNTCRTSIQKIFFFFASTFFRHISYIFTKVNDASKQQCISMRNYILYILIIIFLAFSLVGGWIKIKYYPILFWNFFIMQLVDQLRCTCIYFDSQFRNFINM
jgi:hypothetical protein